MQTKFNAGFLFLLCACIAALLSAACQTDSPSPPGTSVPEVVSGRAPNASVSGTVTYRERLALTPGASLVVELRDASYADAAAQLIARQTISSPGQVPIRFKVEYNRDDIDPRNTYAITARIIESDGRLAFINDTAYDVITRGKPDKIDMILVLVEPPPELLESAGLGSDWRTWVQMPARIVSANLIPNEPEQFLRVVYLQPTTEGCARPGSQESRLDGNDILVRVTLTQPPPTPWSIPCDDQLVELDVVEHLGTALQPGRSYRVIVNDTLTTVLSIPDTHLGHTTIDESLIQSVEVSAVEGEPVRYEARIVSGMPRGSGCSQFNGYEIRRDQSNTIGVTVTHHEISDPDTMCTTDFPMVETVIPLGSDFEPGREYTVSVNSDVEASFVAR